MKFGNLLPSWLRRRRPKVSVLRLSGVIGGGGPLRGGGLNLDGLNKMIERAFAPRGLSAVALAINSPGGSPVQSALIARRIRQIADKKDIKVIAFAEDVAASGGYWLACAADEIFAEESSILGSVGVISAGFGFNDLLSRYGVERRVHTAGARKAMLDPFQAENADDVTRLKSIQADIHENFKDHVRARRGDRLTGAEDDIFNGDIFLGKEALALGLIDGIGDLQTTLRERYGDKLRLNPIGQRRSLLRRRLGVETRDLADDLIASVEDWSHWKRFGL
ncbi:MAG: S49 family peptidase [Rhodospirillales bacterium]|nr:S49 family peptidase [Rhodospirillales bacterium]